MTTLRLKDKPALTGTLNNERQVAVRYKPKKKAYGGARTRVTHSHSLTHMDRFVGQPVELRLSTGETLTGSFTLTRYDILLDCHDGRLLCCHKHQVVWCRLIGSDET